MVIRSFTKNETQNLNFHADTEQAEEEEEEKCIDIYYQSMSTWIENSMPFSMRVSVRVMEYETIQRKKVR